MLFNNNRFDEKMKSHEKMYFEAKAAAAIEGIHKLEYVVQGTKGLNFGRKS